MKVRIVSGGRDYQDREHVWRVLDEEKPDLVVYGGCACLLCKGRGEFLEDQDWYRCGLCGGTGMTGAARWVYRWALVNGVAVHAYPAQRGACGQEAEWMRDVTMARQYRGYVDGEWILFPGTDDVASSAKAAQQYLLTVRDERWSV